MRNEWGYAVREQRTGRPPEVFAETRYARLRWLEQRLQKRPIRRSELARRFAVSDRTASRWLNELALMRPVISNKLGYWYELGSQAEECLRANFE